MSPEQFMREYERATSAHDLEGTLAMIDPDAVYFFSDRTVHVGIAAIRAVLASNFQAIKNELYELRDLRWLAVSSEVAACVYAFQWQGEIDGQPRLGEGRGSSVLNRKGERWLVVHEHLNSGRLSDR